MATLTYAQRVFMFMWIIGSVAAGVLEAKPGEDVTLQCNSPTDAAVQKLVWSRLGLKEENVFFFRGNRSEENSQDPRYRGRVELKDPQMKNRDASVVLKTVTIKDTGTYQCRVTPNMPTELLRYVCLIVSEGPQPAGGPGSPSMEGSMEGLKEEIQKLKVGLGVSLGLVCPLVGVACFALGYFWHLKCKSGPL